MSLTQLAADELEGQLPGLLVGASVVALVPATDLRGWAAETAWQVARAAAASGRRTALVDCFVDAPTLHSVQGSGNDEGIVDVFEYGASLNRIVQQQPQANLFFVPTGTFAADAEPLLQNPRWRRLSAGFRHEEALLLLYVGAEHLGGLAAEPDGIVVLAPQGLDLAVADAPALTEAVGRGMPVLAVVANTAGTGDGGLGTETPKTGASGHRGTDNTKTGAPGHRGTDHTETGDRRPETVAAVPEPSRRSRASAPMAMLLEGQNQPNWFARIGIVLGLAAAGAMVWYAVTQSRVAAATSSADSAAAARAAAPPVTLPPSESLPFAVQVAALPTLGDALTLADTLEARGTPALVAPIRLPGRGVIFRVHAGPFATAARADSVLAALRAAGTLSANAGSSAAVPLSIVIGGGLDLAAARAERLRLRGAGVPVFILGQSDGTFRLYAGAYDATAQAVLLQDLLTPTGSAGELVPRAGYVP